MSKRRKHHKITRELPDELIEVVNKLLVEGTTYREIADFLREKGHEISKSSVQRYGKDFLARLERLRVVKEKARAIIEDDPDRPATEMAEAANLLAMNLIMETLEQLDDLSGEKVTELLKALARLEQSGVARERLKLSYRKKADRAVKNIEDSVKSKNLDPETLRMIKEQIYGIVDSRDSVN